MKRLLVGALGSLKYTAVARFKVSLGKLPRESNIRQSDLQAPEKFPDQASAAGPNGNLPSTSFDVPLSSSHLIVLLIPLLPHLIALLIPLLPRSSTTLPAVCPPLSSTHRDRLYASPSSWPTYPRSDSQAPTTASYSQFARSPSARPTSPSQHRNASEPIISDPTTLVKATDIIVAISKHVSVSVSVTHAHLINRAILSPVAGSPAHLPPSKITT
ncbi:hypothetical protein PGT21_035047 [Puccinia graminis f. sp. tritici]|uniref:Uncharacterized protein n=1 Tax=Puccinia graminis f. sp. tritici TaxID=56615 RepID=A0A5B0QCU6_PUCGR|nr:hypothetical protein PGT21_035047 [Puccinia graminis f. sp. tritici]